MTASETAAAIAAYDADVARQAARVTRRAAMRPMGQHTAFRTGLITSAVSQGYTDLLVLSYNRYRSIDVIWRNIKHLHRVIDGIILDTDHPERMPIALRSAGEMYVEGYPRHPHLHTLWRFPTPDAASKFRSIFQEDRTKTPIWTKIVTSGSYYSAEIDNQEQIANYCSKEGYPDREAIYHKYIQDFYS